MGHLPGISFFSSAKIQGPIFFGHAPCHFMAARRTVWDIWSHLSSRSGPCLVYTNQRNPFPLGIVTDLGMRLPGPHREEKYYLPRASDQEASWIFCVLLEEISYLSLDFVAWRYEGWPGTATVSSSARGWWQHSEEVRMEGITQTWTQNPKTSWTSELIHAWSFPCFWFFIFSVIGAKKFLLFYRHLMSTEEMMLLNCGVGEDSWESLGLQGDPTSPS